MKIPSPLSHAYIITGGSAHSRAAFARQLTAAYLCEGDQPPCGRCRHCRKVEGGIHPDVSLTTLPEDKREILVDQIRTLRTDAYIRPNEGKRKVYLIDPADAMRQESQNALLKVLEEGPAYTCFLLMAEQPGRLLDTIRSRCETLLLPPEETPLEPRLREQAEELTKLLITGSETELAEYCVGLEESKLKSDAMLELLAAVETMASRWLTREPARTVRLLIALKEIRKDSALHPNPGHTLGWLCCRMFR